MWGLAEEEAAKALILMDAARCPSRLVDSKIGAIVNWFYDHLARLIYAEATLWRPVDVAELRTYVDSHRKTHYLEGIAGEYIAPNWSLYSHESLLYADIEAEETGTLGWNSPDGSLLATEGIATSGLPPNSLLLAEGMSTLGVFTPGGLKATSQIWGEVEFR